jgi:hypothetical protein
VGLIQLVAAVLLVLGSYLVLQTALTDRLESRRTGRRETSRSEDRPPWSRAA